MTFEDILIDSVRDVFFDVFGRKSTRVIFRTIEEQYSIPVEDIPQKTTLFSVALENLIGKGHVIIKDLIVETMFYRMGVEFQHNKEFDFINYLEDIKHRVTVAAPS